MRERVGIYLPSLMGGGAERMMVNLANALFKHGFAVDLILVKAEGPYLNSVSSGVRIIDLDSSRILLSVPKLLKYLRQECPQVLLSAMTHVNLVALLVKIIARSPTRVVVSERANFSMVKQESSGFATRIFPWIMRYTYPRADGIVAVSSGVADDLASTIGLPREGISVVYNPVVIEELRILSIEPLHHHWFMAGEPPVLIAAGRLTGQKDFFTLIKAFSRLRTKRQARLVILGEGELRGKLETLVAELGVSNDVALPGFVDNPFAWMSRSALFVLSSAYEGLPGALIQAMACGVPVVSTDCPSGPAEILENGRWGRLVPVGDAESLAAAIDATLDESEHPDVAARAAAFSVDQALAGYLRVLGLKT